jgi:hypothetical protein
MTPLPPSVTLGVADGQPLSEPVVGGIFLRPLEKRKQFVIGVAASQETL